MSQPHSSSPDSSHAEIAGGPPALAHSEEVRRLRHDIRGCMHGLMLLISALETPMSDADRLEFIGDIENTATKMESLMDHLERLPDFSQA